MVEIQKCLLFSRYRYKICCQAVWGTVLEAMWCYRNVKCYYWHIHFFGSGYTFSKIFLLFSGVKSKTPCKQCALKCSFKVIKRFRRDSKMLYTMHKTQKNVKFVSFFSQKKMKILILGEEKCNRTYWTPLRR